MLLTFGYITVVKELQYCDQYNSIKHWTDLFKMDSNIHGALN